MWKTIYFFVFSWKNYHFSEKYTSTIYMYTERVYPNILIILKTSRIQIGCKIYLKYIIGQKRTDLSSVRYLNTKLST